MSAGLAPPPKSVLGRHRLLAPTASVFVSPLCLGAMNFGEAWKSFLGECSKETAFEMLDYFYEQGGNFIDTAVNYQAGESEQWLGEWMQKHGRRNEVVLATKYTGPFNHALGTSVHQSNYGGTGSKSMYVSLESSLKNLQTDYIDLYYVHVWDFTTGIPELMQSLNHLVQQRKVLYLGVSDTPAWVVAQANAYARQHGLRQFSVYQGRWSAAERDFEREIIPMCKSEGMSLAPWGALGGGLFRSPDEGEKQGGRNMPSIVTGKEGSVSVVLDRIAKKKGVPITSIGLAYVMHKAPYVTPIVGGRKVEHLKSNIEALTIQLSPEEIDEIETGYDFQLGFPHNFLRGANKAPQGPEDVKFTRSRVHADFVKGPQPIAPHQGPLDS
ncbi:aryl-alcohol dehydrogenase [Neohortaea acidophila]|uniref:Aryl-alcohol dehydrogenase n=1 Tax=Neohortaea acidophila TaxID=245834 RepID=A0A6A6PJN7_9PEZI|nr:aryl-alcohol dehydrogenase [Neohortaea acidophila]KAF2479477.1 aryl-alcohol dehydrogenase [Neohortaea acidophila]